MKMQLFQVQSLKSRLTFLTLSIFLICVWSLTVYTSRKLQDDMQHLLGVQQFSTATFLAREIDGEFNSRIKAMEQYAKGRIVPSMLTNAAALQERLEGSPAILSMFNAGIFVTGENGIALASVPKSLGRVGVDYMERDSISAAIQEGRSSVSQPIIGKRLQTPVITIAVPVRDATGKIIGALAGVTDLSRPSFLDKVAEGRYGDSGGYLLISPTQNIIVTATDKSRIMQPAPTPGVNAMYDRYLQGYEGSGVAVSSRGVNELSASKRIPVTGWLAIVALPADEAFAPIKALTQHIFMSALVLSLLAIVAIWWLISRVLQQRFAPMIAASRQASTQVSMAEPIPVLPTSRQDEIGELVGSFNDLLVTLKQRDDNLSRERAMLRTLIDALPDLIWLKDEKGVYLACNRRFELFFGASEAEIVGKTDYDFVPKELADFFRQHDRRSMDKNGPSVNEEEVPFAADGHCELLETTKVPMRDAHDNILGVLGIGHDITERKASEAKLQHYRENLEHLVEARTKELSDTQFALNRAGIAIHWVDAKTGRFLYVNDHAAEMLGYTVDEMLQMKVPDLDPNFPEGDFSQVTNTMFAHGTAHFESALRRKDGTLIPIELVGYVFPEHEGQIGRFITFITDISQRKSQEQVLLEAKESAETANLAKSRFLANMSHEIRTPMNAIIGLTHILRRSIKVPEQADKLGKIAASADHLLGVINDILDISKIEAEKVILEKSNFELESLLSRISMMLIDRIHDKHLELIIDAEPGMGVVSGDATRLGQALLNYLGNAIKFTE